MFEMYVLLLHVCLCHEIMFMGPNQHTIELKGVLGDMAQVPSDLNHTL